MKTKEEIVKWLNQHDWYQSFEKNTIYYHKKTFDKYFSEIINSNKQALLIRGAFEWIDSQEGVRYWGKINEEYLKWLKTMKQTIEIEVPEGKKAVWKDGKVVLEDIMPELPELPKTWEEFCDKSWVKSGEAYIERDSKIQDIHISGRKSATADRNLLPSVNAAEAHLALMQLHQLRDCYRQGWVPDWENAVENKWCITNQFGKNRVLSFSATRFFLAFPTKKIAENFFRNFEDLIREAGDLI